MGGTFSKKSHQNLAKNLGAENSGKKVKAEPRTTLEPLRNPLADRSKKFLLNSETSLLRATTTLHPHIRLSLVLFTMKIATKLKIIYLILCMNCALMMFHIFMTQTGDPEAMEAPNSDLQHNFFPLKNFTKYNGHTFANLAHRFPGLFWCACIPIQLRHGIRKKFPKFHKYLGRAFIYTSYILMVGW